MASRSAPFLIFVLFAVVPISTLATEYIVGDDSGWTTNFDYQAWAQDKTFHVGDKLVFRYPAGAHNVFRVNGTGFTNCIKPPVDQALTTGNDTILLTTPGNKWYICGVAKHCESAGQKLKITVLSYQAPSPIAAPPSSGIPYEPGTPLPSPSSAPTEAFPTENVPSGYETPAPSPVEEIPWNYGSPAPSPVEEIPWDIGSPAPSPVEEIPWNYGSPAPSPVEEIPWNYGSPAPSPVEEIPQEYGSPPAPAPVEDVPWGYGAPVPAPVEDPNWEYGVPAPTPVEYPWEYGAPAPTPDASSGSGSGYAAKKRPFINYL